MNQRSKFDNSIWMDSNQQYRFDWSIDRAQKVIRIAVTVKTTGWIGLGVSNGHHMGTTRADVAFGWINLNGEVALKDCYVDWQGKFLEDEKQDLQLIDAWQDDAWSVMIFQLKIVTCDDNDLDFKDDTMTFLYSWGLETPVWKTCSDLSKVKWNFKNINILRSNRRNSEVPPEVKLLDIETKKIKPMITEGHTPLLHHMSLFACKDSFNPRHLSYSGLCFGPDVPSSVRDCHGMSGLYSWGRGAEDLVFPENVGWPIGGKDGIKYIVLEVHINNPSREKGYAVKGGFRLFYGQPRQYTASMLTLGVSDSSISIPPQKKKWTLKGVCTKSCTKKLQENNDPNAFGSIKLFGVLLHAHKNAVEIRVALVRNGEEVKEISRFNNFKYFQQRIAPMDPEVEIQPGDEINLYCTYNTLHKRETTHGGMGSDDEMCFAFFLYYPKRNLSFCGTDAIPLPSIGSRSLFKRSFWKRMLLERYENNSRSPYDLFASNLPRAWVPVLVKKRLSKAICPNRQLIAH
eukprot:gene9065-16713_t